MNNLLSNTKIIIIGFLIVAIGVGIYLVGQRTSLLPKAAPPTPADRPGTPQEISSDMVIMTNELDGVDINVLNDPLKQNAQDAATF